MKIMLGILLSFTLLQGCQSQSDFDLAKIILNQDKVSDIIPKDIKLATYDNGVTNGDNKYASTGSDKILIFNQINLSGENPKANYENKAVVYFNIQDSIITRYQLDISVTKQSEELLKTLKEKLGNPNYTGFSSEKDKMDNLPSEFIWEDIENNILYHLSYSKQHYGIDANLNVLPIMKTYPALPGITYWESFMHYREKSDNTNYTYQDFLKERLENDPDNIQNKLSK
ncbi:hypothetical protein DNU06_15765 [Putridiphycobacter roseus]|uniref:Uncharacterized protein n=1 Tax=Putridiphycobacter roseus TaxID=2219161 RepID=A0A2W1NCJ1_9FLAO|nr:hypothetical protein [Putridiphycobacter roseus]PZE15836.1 hypothetical protein DNU06_15765 [Putridiphycobacter roseus]